MLSRPASYFDHHPAAKVTWVAAATAPRVLPIVICGPFGGLLADRLDRRRLMIGSDAVRAAAMLALAGVAAAGWPIMLAPVLAGLATVAAAPYPSCVAASTPQLVPEERLAGANAARSAVNSASVVLGPALGGVLLAVGSPTTAFLINAVTFAVSALLIAALPARQLHRPAAADTDRPRPIADLAAGMAALRRSRTALRLVGADTSCSLVYGAQTVLFVLLARTLGYGGAGYGWLLAGCGVGGVLGTALAPRLAATARPRLVLASGLLTVAIPLPLFTVTGSLAVAVLLAAVSGAGAMLVEVLTDTGLQRCLDEQVLGRAYGLAFAAAIGGIALGSLLAALLGTRGALLGLGVLVIGHGLALLRRPGSRTTPAQHRAAEPVHAAVS